MRIKLVLVLIILCINNFASGQPTSFMTGDIAVLALNANNTTTCGGTSGDDEISFVCFKPVTAGTTLDLTDNGYERLNPGLWGDSEGTYRATRTGGTIPAGTVITFRISNNVFSSVAPDAGWSFSSLNGISQINMNSGGDQLYFMQNGAWQNGNTDAVLHNASYNGGNILFAFNTKTTWNADGGTQQSNLYPYMDCFNMSPTGGASDFIKYTGPTTATTQKNWVLRISNPANWTKYANCTDYNSNGPQYNSAYSIVITEFFNVDAGATDTVCENISVLSLNGSPAGGIWHGTGVTDTIAGVFSPLSTGSGTYFLTYVFDDSGCLYNDNKTVVVKAKPNINFLPASIQSCAGTEIALNGNPSGGTTPYVSSWTGDIQYLTNTNTPASTFSCTTPGTYNLNYSVTDKNGCNSEIDKTITIYSNPSLTINISDTSFCENTQVEILANANGGSGVFTSFVWTGNTANLNSVSNDTVYFSSQANGNYNITCTVTDNNGCKGTKSSGLIVFDVPIINLPTQQSVCSGDNLNISAAITGGVGNYSTSWSGDTIFLNSTNTSTPMFISDSAGNYNLYATVIDANNCQNTDSVSIVTLDNPIVSIITSTDSICENIALPITGNITGGSGNYISFTWSGDSALLSNTSTASSVLSSSQNGTYNFNLSVTDNNNCKGESNTTITVLDNPTINFHFTDTIICEESSIFISSTIAGGSGSQYSFVWNGDTDFLSSTITQQPIFTGDTSGIFNPQLTVTDSLNCNATSNVEINVSEKPIISLSSDSVQCFNACNGTAIAEITGGSVPFSFQWNDPLNQTDSVASNLCTGNYKITVTDKYGCKDSAQIDIFQPSEIIISLNSTNTSCGNSNGAITANVAGGSGSYIYNWSNGISNTNALNNITAGTYRLTVTDNNNCTKTDSVTLFDTGSPAIDSVEIVTPKCNNSCDASAFAFASLGNPPYTFSWSNSTLGDSIYNICSGTYNVTVSDQNNCKGYFTFNIAAPSPLLLVLNLSDSISCNGLCDGKLIANTTGGTGQVNYTWSHNNQLNSQTALGLCAGTYTATATDANNCNASASANIQEPASIQISNSNIQNSSAYGVCDGTANILATGGTGSLAYLWSNGDNSVAADSICAGTIYVSITDDNMCEKDTSFIIQQPNPLIAQLISISHASCSDSCNGSAELNVVGGNPPYFFTWPSSTVNNATASGLCSGTYIVTVSDINGQTDTISFTINEPSGINTSIEVLSEPTCFGNSDATCYIISGGGTGNITYLWSNNSNNDTIKNITAGTFYVTATDANGCTENDSIVIEQPQKISSVLSATNVKCFGENTGISTISASGGTMPYAYIWSNGGTANNISSLAAGKYFVTITDVNYCMAKDSVIITQPDFPVSNIISTANISCYNLSNGSASSNTSGGTPPYQYLWSNGSTANQIINLNAGKYKTTITDNNNCQVKDSVVISQPEELTIEKNITNATCREGNDGSIDVTAMGGTAPYSFEWNDGTTLSKLINKPAGEYSVKLSDKQNCSIILKVIIGADDKDCIEIPSCFTPNNDGKNDEWVIKNIELFPASKITVFNRWGQIVFSTVSANKKWDGTYNGNDVPAGTYLYIIERDNSTKTYNGTITIVR